MVTPVRAERTPHVLTCGGCEYHVVSETHRTECPQCGSELVDLAAPHSQPADE